MRRSYFRCQVPYGITQNHCVACLLPELKGLVADFRPLLQLEEGCLVHKDLALWNVLGENDKISAVIDWDDAVSGDTSSKIASLVRHHQTRYRWDS